MNPGRSVSFREKSEIPLMPQSFRRRPLAIAFGFVLGALVAWGQGEIVPKKDPKKEAEKGPVVEKGNTGGQPETEDPMPKKVRPFIPIDDEAPIVNVPKGAYYLRIEELARATADAKTPELRAVFVKYVVAFDVMVDQQEKPFRITPIPVYRLAKIPPVFGVFDLDDKGFPLPHRRVDSVRVRRFLHFEELIVEESEKLMDSRVTEPRGVDMSDRVDAAEKLLAGALYFHDTARDQSKRKGIGWEQVRAKLVEMLANTRLARLNLAAERKDWKIVRSLGSRMAGLYPNDKKLLEQVFSARLAEAANAVAESDQPADLELARNLLIEFESQFPGSKSDVAERIRDGLKQKARRLFELASTAIKQNDQKRAQLLIRTVEIIDPSLAGLRDLQGQLTGGYSILYVGTRQLPERMTPLTARFASEHAAVDLIFEPLLEGLPDDPHGTKYRPALAAGMPAPVGLARDFQLVRAADWAGLEREYFDAADVAGTLRGIRERHRHTWIGRNVGWLAEQARVEDRANLRIGFASGHPYPLSLMTTKILPSRWLAAQNKQLDDMAFAVKPAGTGPFRLLGAGQPKDGPPEVVFVANPAFGRRPGRIGQPFIKEIHFIDMTKVADPTSLFRSGQLHLLPDVPTAELARFTAIEAKLNGVAEVVTSAANRQIHYLAINHHRPELNSVALRRGVSHAIDREEILDKVYRAGFKNFHKALVGPYPPDSWAVPKIAGSVPPPLFNANLAQAKLAEYAGQAGAKALSLVYSTEDPRSRVACEAIRKQVEFAAAALVKVTVNLEGLSAIEFHKRVYEDRNFDLAYVAFEYPDEWYPQALGALLDPEAQEGGGRNFMRYPPKTVSPSREDKQLGQQLEEIRRHSDFAGKLAPQAHDLQRRFVEAMPFIPLWQLDRHSVVSSKLKIHFDDVSDASNPKWLPPSEPFTGVARWKLLD
jgi:peptide/nickel transport system substrate-binding protein